eukprot:1154430-Pelagomonas_calceolata.AAC.4
MTGMQPWDVLSSYRADQPSPAGKGTTQKVFYGLLSGKNHLQGKAPHKGCFMVCLSEQMDDVQEKLPKLDNSPPPGVFQTS